MRRVALAVLLVLFMLSAALPLTLAVPDAYLSAAPLSFNPGLDENDGNFDLFTQTIVLRPDPVGHVVADLNNDSRNDLAVIYHDSTVMDIFLAGTSNNFTSTPSRTVTFLHQPTGLAAGDMDDDEEMDLVISLDYDGPKNIAICYQKNDFSSAEPQAKYLDGSNKQKGVLVSDLNGDSLLDIVALNSMDDALVTAGFFVYRSISLNTYGFTAVTLTDMHFPDLMVMGDLNGDGRQDLIFGDRTAKMVVCYRNDAAAATTWTQIAPINNVIATALLAEQATGDGREELFIALAPNPPNTMEPVIRVLRYSNTTSLVNELVDEIPDQPQVTWLTMVMNSIDGRMDLARTSSDLHNLTIFNTPAINPMWRYDDSISSPTPAEPMSVLSSDMNADGLSDLVVLCNSSAKAGILTIYYHSGTAISNANDNLVTTEANLELATAGDMNGDGSQDIAFYDGASHKIIFYNATHARFDDLPVMTGAVDLDAEDLNGDRKDELVLVNETSVTVWWGSGTFFSSATSSTMAVSMTPRSIGFGDLNGDGFNELIIGCLGGLEVYWNDGSATPYRVDDRFVLTLPGSDVTAVRTGLFSGDGDVLADIAVINATADRVEIYYQQSSSPPFSVASRMLLTVVPNVGDLVCGDLNGDGRPDLATHSNDTLYLFLQYPGGFFGAPEFPMKLVPGEGIDSLSVGNMDDLGIVELVMLSENSTVTAFSYDTVHATFVPLTVQTVGAAPGALMIADLNRDGKDDLAVHSFASRSTSIFYQNNFPPIAHAAEEGSNHLEGDTVWFNADGTFDTLSDQESLTYAWTFGDGLTGTGNRTSHEFKDNGIFNVVLNVTDRSGAFNITTVFVSIGDQSPIADFSHSGETVEGSSIIFTDQSFSPTDDIWYWNWSFGDGERSNQTSNVPVFHTYARNGTFTVTLTVTDEDGSQNSTSRSITVQDSSPAADFSVSSYSPFEGQEVTITDLSVPAADAIENWSWDLGDGTWVNRTTGGTFAHTYIYNGTYQVRLVVRDADGSEDSMSRTITVRDSAPLAGFTASVSSPSEGEEISFNDTSTFPVNEIVSWYWDLGDGATFDGQGPVLHTYADNGTYPITLTVTDVDGNTNTTSRTVTVKDTSPVISRLFTVGGGTSFEEWDEIAFRVHDTPQWDSIVRYQWDFGGTIFQSDVETEENSTSHRYASSGTYRVTVRVWDSDSYTESSIQITIIDPAPVPDFTSATNTANRTVGFSAALTLDTENDYPNLMYRWNFGDTVQTEWNRSQLTNHTYLMDGVYSVRLEVKDDHNPAVIRTKNVTIDLLPPDISMDEPVLKAVVGEPTLIRVTVTDLVGIDNVILEYTIDNVTRTIVMTSEGNGIYFAQIPAQNRTMELAYRIVAEDRAGHTATTEQFTLILEYEDPSLFLYTSLALLMAFLAIIIYLFLSRPIIDEVFVMYHDGTLLAHQTRRLKPGMDDEILGGMLIALQNFVRDSFKDESSTVLRRMDFGERKLLVERKDDFFMAVVLSGKRAGNAAQRMLKVLDNIEEGYAPVLKEWDGDLEKVRGIRDETKPMFSRANPLDRLKRKEGEDDSV